MKILFTLVMLSIFLSHGLALAEGEVLKPSAEKIAELEASRKALGLPVRADIEAAVGECKGMQKGCVRDALAAKGFKVPTLEQMAERKARKEALDSCMRGDLSGQSQTAAACFEQFQAEKEQAAADPAAQESVSEESVVAIDHSLTMGSAL